MTTFTKITISLVLFISSQGLHGQVFSDSNSIVRIEVHINKGIESGYSSIDISINNFKKKRLFFPCYNVNYTDSLEEIDEHYDNKKILSLPLLEKYLRFFSSNFYNAEHDFCLIAADTLKYNENKDINYRLKNSLLNKLVIHDHFYYYSGLFHKKNWVDYNIHIKNGIIIGIDFDCVKLESLVTLGGTDQDILE